MTLLPSTLLFFPILFSFSSYSSCPSYLYTLDPAYSFIWSRDFPTQPIISFFIFLFRHLDFIQYIY